MGSGSSISYADRITFPLSLVHCRLLEIPKWAGLEIMSDSVPREVGVHVLPPTRSILTRYAQHLSRTEIGKHVNERGNRWGRRPPLSRVSFPTAGLPNAKAM